MKTRTRSILKALLQQQEVASERGFTLIEIIAAIVILTIAFAAAAAPLLLSAATRIQSRRIQQAEALAQQEIDRVKALLLRTQGVSAAVETGLIPPESAQANIDDTPAPTVFLNSDTSGRGDLNLTTEALGFDLDEDDDDDYFIQLIRSPAVRLSRGNIGQAGIFEMVVRVYDSSAAVNLGSLETDAIDSILTNTLAAPRTNPLAVSRTTISQSDAGLSLEDLRLFIECQNDPMLPDCP